HVDMYDDALVPQLLAELDAHRVLTIGVTIDPAAYDRACALAGQSSWIVPTFGIHPWNAAENVDQLESVGELIARSPMLGEIGLDFLWVEDRAKDAAQRRVFTHFLQAAHDQHKIVNLHTKAAEAEILESLDRYRVERAIVHWYSGPLDIANALAARGAMFSIGVELHSSALIQELARRLPLQLLLTETDNPGALRWLTGELGLPSHLPGVLAELARLRGMDEAELRDTILANFTRLIDGDPHMADVRARLRDA
ncbi:MAG TPA: TatD family hydrolase, partial [Roseiflexaceae bacterium]|nr:TatD family hydrolase [Roseiflexaceae bacterium]